METWLECYVGKNPRNFEVEHLRIILLFEADCNQNNKWLGHAFMKEAERCELLAAEQYGSCQNKDAITQCLNKQLWYDYICCTQQPAALCSNDAKSCYDRIVLLIATLCMCRLGAKKMSVLSMLKQSAVCATIHALFMATPRGLPADRHGLNLLQVLVKGMGLVQQYGPQ